MNDIDKATTLAAHLVTITTSLGEYIEDQARQIAQPRVEEARRNADRRVAGIRSDLGFQVQRLEDVVAELRRQVEAQVKRADRADRQVRVAHEYGNRLRAAGLEREADELRELMNRSRFADAARDGRVADGDAEPTRVWSVMHAKPDGRYQPVGVEGSRRAAESEMYDWARDCPGEVRYGFYDRTGWQLSDEEVR